MNDDLKWLQKKCVIPGCPQPVPSSRNERLCDEHYAPVSDEAVARHIARVLGRRPQQPGGSDRGDEEPGHDMAAGE
jgi:hypothetical protein